jgi:hypothetical protein
VLLPNGEVAILGGVVEEPLHQEDVEKYDPKTRKFRLAGKLSTYAQGATANLLPDGKILIAGNDDGTTVINGKSVVKLSRTAQLYDPVTENSRFISPMKEGRWEHTSVSLKDGRVLIVGGDENWATDTPPSLEIYDPKTETFTFWGRLKHFRGWINAIQLKDGQILIVGGLKNYIQTRPSWVVNM